MGDTTAQRNNPIKHDQCADDASGEADPKTGDQGIAHEFIRKNRSQLFNHGVPRVGGWEARDVEPRAPGGQRGNRSPLPAFL